MKKIMFNDKYRLTRAVLEGRKTMTRRAVTMKLLECIRQYSNGDEEEFRYRMIANTPYKVGEIVAIAQRYKDVALHIYNKKIVRLDKEDGTDPKPLDMIDTLLYLQSLKGFDNKMYVKSEWMPHHIQITSIRVQPLQDITDEDCLKEGVEEHLKGVQYGFPSNIGYCGQYPFSTPRDAFAALIDKISGKGTWEINPLVWVYEFKHID